MEEIDDSTRKIEAKNVLLLLQERFTCTSEDPNFTLVAPDRIFLMEERFDRVDVEKGSTYKPCQLFLFNDMLLFAVSKKNRKKTEAKFNKAMAFSLRQLIVVDDEKGFHLISSDKTKATVSTSFDQKTRWLAKLNSLFKAWGTSNDASPPQP